MKRFVVMGILGCGLLSSLGVSKSKEDAAVWALEEDYWRYLKAGDVVGYQQFLYDVGRYDAFFVCSAFELRVLFWGGLFP